MGKTFSISIYLDTRRAKKDDKYPVKLMAAETLANAIAERLPMFTFEAF